MTVADDWRNAGATIRPQRNRTTPTSTYTQTVRTPEQVQADWTSHPQYGQGNLAGWATPLPVPVASGGGGSTGGGSTAVASPPPVDNSAIDYLRRFFANIGLTMDAELEGILTGAMQNGYTPADVESGVLMPDIQKSAAFQMRFPGYNARIANHHNAISIRDYLALEDTYRGIMANAGLPAGFYDDPSDMGQWIAKNTSPAEIEGRVRMATQAAQSVDPTMRNLMAQFYGLSTGDVAAYFLDPNRTLPLVEKQYKTAEVASWASRNGYQVNDMARYQTLLEAGVTGEQAAQGYGTVRALDQSVGQVASIYGESYGQGDAEQDVFFNKNEKRRRIMAQEAATFSGSSRGATGSAQRQSY